MRINVVVVVVVVVIILYIHIYIYYTHTFCQVYIGSINIRLIEIFKTCPNRLLYVPLILTNNRDSSN